eukprot:comp22334_c0_seq1/m.33215 comp22334_c0_seq1/g.33215  ORF comp22334_c0_seq1/g.33215 comp22334_c0_seq1/m.33215 type:complete len:540 (-) comp22334_c0_seq1:166-1785(-)
MTSQSGKLKLTVVEGRDLKAMDGGKSSDPFVKIYVDGKEVIKTPVVKKDLNPVWNHTVDIDIDHATMVTFKVYDHEMIGAAEEMGDGTIMTPLKELEKVDIWVPVSTRGQIHFTYEFTSKDLLENALAAEALGLGAADGTEGTAMAQLRSDAAAKAAVAVDFPHGYGFADKPLSYMTAAGRKATTQPYVFDAKAMAMKHGLWPAIHYALSVLAIFILGRLGFGALFALATAWFLTLAMDTYNVRAVRDETKAYTDVFDSKNYPETESTLWLNGIMDQVVCNYAKTIADEVIANVQKSLDQVNIPGMKLNFKAFAPGSNAPDFHDWRVHRGQDKDLCIDFRLDWVADFRIVIEVKQAVGGMTLVAQNLNVQCKVRIFTRLLKDREPFLSYLWVQMPERPKIDVEIQGLGAELPGVIPLLKSKITDTVESMMVFPNRLEIDIAGPKGVQVDEEDKLKAAPAVDPETGLVGNLVGGVGAVGGAAIGAVGAVGGAAVGAVGAVGKGAVGAVGAVGSGVASLGKGAVGSLGKGFKSLTGSPKGK